MNSTICISSFFIFFLSLSTVALECNRDVRSISSLHCDETIDFDLFELPRPDPIVQEFKLVIDMDIGPLIKIKKDRKTIRNQSTGSTPKKPRSHCLDTPIKKVVGISARLMQKEGRAGSKSGRQCKIIYSNDTSFASGQWTFADPLCATSSVAIDCDNLIWDMHINSLVEEIKSDSQANFIASVIELTHSRLEELSELLYFCSQEKELECRHFATLALPIFTKLLEHSDIPFSGRIQQISADVVDHNWLKSDDGHVWNMLTIIDLGVETHWLVDVTHKVFINLTETPYLTKLKATEVLEHGKMKSYALTSKNIHYDYARITKEKFDISPGKAGNLYYDQNTHQLASSKVILGSILPKAKSIIKVGSKPMKRD